MTRKDFNRIANVLAGERRAFNDNPARAVIDGVADSLAVSLAETNDQFNKSRFLAACKAEG